MLAPVNVPTNEAPVEEAPVSAPAETPVEVDASFDEDFDFQTFSETVPNETVGETPPVVQSPAPVAEKPAEAAPPVPPVQPPQAPVQAAPQVVAPAATPPPVTPGAPQEQPAASPQAAPTAPTAAPAEDDDTDGLTRLTQAIEQSKGAVIEAVAIKSYQLTQEELEQVQTEPEKVLPRLMAKVHVEAVQGVLRHVAQQIPAMVSGVMRMQTESRSREEEFFKAWPQLDRAKHSQDIFRAGQVYRQLNPNATIQDFIKNVGAQVIIQHGLHLQAAQQAQPQQQVTAPLAPQPVPFAPAGVGRTSAPTAPAQPNVWEELITEMEK